MYKRVSIYLKEMYPPLQRLILVSVLFFAIFFLLLALHHRTDYVIGLREAIAIATIFVFFLSLRIADEFKDFDTDKKNFPERPLPSGRVTKRDLVTLLFICWVPVVVLNLLYMNNLPVLFVLCVYGALSSVWFFAKDLIKPNLVAALITHNPLQAVINLYSASYVCAAYGFELWSPTTLTVVLALYMPGFIWEVGRKIRAPNRETAYTTYSKLWGYTRAIAVIIAAMLIALTLNYTLLARISQVAAVASVVLGLVAIIASIKSIHRPQWTVYLPIATFFIYTQQLLLLVAAIGNVNQWWS